ncbi:MAG: hypothetical protein R2748_07775 [Bryobacterales bacterium]
MTRWVLTTGAFLILTAAASAGEAKLMHCFAFTELEGATEADWKAFYKATDELPSKIEGLNKVWYGKLRRPLAQYNRDGKQSIRQSGVCMEMDDEKALRAYDESDAHAEWVKVYEKVRVAGTTTYDILGQ